MADRRDHAPKNQLHHRVRGTSILYATLAGVAIGGPLLGIMGLTFFASATLLLLMSPLLVIFSPLLFIAGAVLTLALLGFAVAIGTAVAGISVIGWTINMLQTRNERRFVVEQQLIIDPAAVKEIGSSSAS